MGSQPQRVKCPQAFIYTLPACHQAEHTIRQRVDKDPTHARAFAALGHILEVREQYIPAHAEYQRAKERTSQNSLECVYYDLLIKRVQGIIEAQAAGLLDQTADDARVAPTPAVPSARVLRRAGEEPGPSEESAAAPSEESAASPSEESAASPSEESAAAPSEESAAAPSEESAAAPSEESAAAP
ncbi:MAG: hypothetical protein ACFB8W_22575, partial [Elainellaceae cyanobacterium]